MPNEALRNTPVSMVEGVAGGNSDGVCTSGVSVAATVGEDAADIVAAILGGIGVSISVGVVDISMLESVLIMEEES
jgi:hypothetical protein